MVFKYHRSIYMLYLQVLSPATEKVIKPHYQINFQKAQSWNLKKTVLKTFFKYVVEMSVVDILLRRLICVSPRHL